MMNNQPQPTTPQEFPKFVIFKIDNAKVNIDVFFYDETLWLTQKQLADLFEKGRSTISRHLKNIFDEKELDEKVVCRDFRHTTQHGAIEGKIQENEIELFENQVISQMETTCKDFLQVQRIV